MGFSRQEDWSGVKWKYLLPYQSIKNVTAISDFCPPMWMRALQTAIQHMPPAPWWLLKSWGNARSKMNKDWPPDSRGVYERNEFSESRGLHPPICRMLNSLTWYLIFDVQTSCSLCCKLVYSLTFSSASLEQFSQSYWDAVSRAQSPRHSHQIKLLSAFRLWVYFSVNNGLPCSSPGDLPGPGIELTSLALQADSLPTEPPRGAPCINIKYHFFFQTYFTLHSRL